MQGNPRKREYIFDKVNKYHIMMAGLHINIRIRLYLQGGYQIEENSKCELRFFKT